MSRLKPLGLQVVMGKDLNGIELGRGIHQRKDGRYNGRIRINGIDDICLYDFDLENLIRRLDAVKEKMPKQIKFNVPDVKNSYKTGNCSPSEGGYVYFISDGSFCKIGVASNIKRRLGLLQTGNPNELKIIHSIYSKTPYVLEEELHQKYKKYHIRGEWYDIMDIIVWMALTVIVAESVSIVEDINSIIGMWLYIGFLNTDYTLNYLIFSI